MTSHSSRHFELSIASRIEEMNAVHRLVGEAVIEYELDQETAHWIELAVSESMINAIRHGNSSDPSKRVTLRISSTGDAIEMTVEDQGPGFVLERVADPTEAENLMKPCGRGILIIRSFMDEVDLSQCEHGGCRLRMVKKISGRNRR